MDAGTSVTDKQALATYLDEISAKRLGDANALQAELVATTNDLKSALQRNHNDMMLLLETALASEADRLQIGLNDARQMSLAYHTHFDATLKSVLPKALAATAASELIANAVGLYVAPYIAAVLRTCAITILTTLGVDLGQKAVLLAGGSALAPETGGLSFVVCVVLAIGIDIATDKIAQASVREDILRGLNDLRETTIANFASGARKGVVEIHEARRVALHEALIKTIAAYATK